MTVATGASSAKGGGTMATCRATVWTGATTRGAIGVTRTMMTAAAATGAATAAGTTGTIATILGSCAASAVGMTCTAMTVDADRVRRVATTAVEIATGTIA